MAFLEKKFLTSGLLYACVFASAMAAMTSVSANGHFTIFQAPGAGRQKYEGTRVYSINDSGVIVGSYFDKKMAYHGFIRTPDGQFQTVNAKGAGVERDQGTVLVGINNKGAVSGFFYDQKGYSHGLERTSKGLIQRFQAVHDPMVATFPDGINGHGVIAGSYYLSNSINPRGFLRDERSITLIDIPESYATDSYNINSDGTIVGDYKINPAWQGYARAADGTFTYIDVPGAGTINNAGTIPSGINSLGEISGRYIDDNLASHGFARAPDGAIVTYDVSGAGTEQDQGTFSGRINASGLIAGDYTDSANVSHGYIRQADGTISTFDAPHSGTIAYTGTFVTGLSSDGAIVGWTADNNYVSRSFLRN